MLLARRSEHWLERHRKGCRREGDRQMNVANRSIFVPPKPSRAQRPFLRKTPNHFVGELTFGEDRGQGQTLGFGSKLEHDIGLVVIYTPGVADVREQVEVHFIKANGDPGQHYIDFVSYERSGRRTGILVKKQSYADRAKFQDTASRVAFAAIPLVVDRVVIATERVLERNLMARVEQFHSYRFAQPDIDQKLAEALPQLDGPSSIRAFLEMAGLGIDGFHGVVRMVRFQKLAAPVPGLLSMSSIVQPWPVTA